MSGRLAGKVAVITGAASGIGLRTAQRFAEEGAKVLLTDIQNDKGAEAARALGPNAVYQHCDVSRESDIQAAIDAAVARHGRLDVLLSNAGVGGNRAPIEELDIEVHARPQEKLLPFQAQLGAAPLAFQMNAPAGLGDRMITEVHVPAVCVVVRSRNCRADVGGDQCHDGEGELCQFHAVRRALAA